MHVAARTPIKPPEPTFAELFTPKLVTILRAGYTINDFKADAIAGLTVAIVALPLSMAIAIGSGLSPEKGLYTAIVGGFLISALGGSRFQIGGPAGAFIVLIASIVERQGYDGLVLATLLAGLMMMAAGFLRLGTYIKYIPFPVTVGFTAGIAVIILASQVKELLGLDITSEPSALLPKLGAIWQSLGTIKPATVALGAIAIATIVGLRRVCPKWPGMLIAVVVTAVLAAVLHLDVTTIGSKFGDVPRMLPAPALPAFDLAKIRDVLPDAIAIAMLGAIESLLSAVVADGMSGRSTAPTASWSRRARPTSPPWRSAACAPPAPSLALPLTCVPVRAALSPASCTPSTYSSLCSWPRRLPPISRWPAWAASSSSLPGTWPRRRSLPACCAPRGATRSF